MIRLLLLLFLATPVAAQTLVATHNIRPRDVIMPEDVELRDISIVGGLQSPQEAVGLEARIAIYEGRPIRASDVAAPALVERNQIVTLLYISAGLTISTEGRALDRGGAGDRIRIMNLASRVSVTAEIAPDGRAIVNPQG